jgi:hypothetical protein
MRKARSSNISMTTKPHTAIAYVRAIAAILAIWFGGVAALTVIAEPTPSVVVVGPVSTVLRAAIASDTTILDVHPTFSRLHSGRRGFVRDLYRSGAWFVWPAIDGGCFF